MSDCSAPQFSEMREENYSRGVGLRLLDTARATAATDTVS